MRWTAAILFLSFAAGAVPAAETGDARRAQVAAATADALDALREKLLAASVTADVTVEEFIRRTDGHDELALTLKRAEQIGGTRWVDDQTCEVKMELRGSELADALVEIAADHPREAGMPPNILRKRVADLSEQTFGASGMSTRAVDRLRPDRDDEAWRGVPAEAVRAAVNEARRSAARQILDSVADLPMPGAGDTLGKLFNDQQVRDALEGWAMNRPVTSVEFQPDLEVRVRVAVRGEDFWDELVANVDGRPELPFPSDDGDRAELRKAVLSRVEPTVGRGRASGAPGAAQPDRGGGDAPALRAGVDVPADPPRWAARHADAKGTAAKVDGRLKTARAAENSARAELREEIEALPLSPGLSLDLRGLWDALDALR